MSARDVDAHDVGLCVDLAAAVSLLRQAETAQAAGEDPGELWRRAFSIIAPEDHDDALRLAMFVIHWLTWQDPDRLLSALGLIAQIDAFTDGYVR